MAEEKKSNDDSNVHTFKLKKMPDGFNKNKSGTIVESKQNEEKILKYKQYGDRRKILSESNAINVVELTMKSPINGKSYGGSGTIICLDRETKEVYILTCAHNCVSIDPIENTKIYMENMWFEKKQTNVNSKTTKSLCNIKIEKCYIYPKYFSNPTTTSGFDLAILYCKVSDAEFKTLYKGQKWPVPQLGVNYSHEQLDCFVYGYPVDKHGLFCGMSGKVKTGIEYQGTGWSNHPVAKGKVIQYSDIDTYGGMSGCPIVWGYNGGYWRIAGVHTGGLTSVGKNWGTELKYQHIAWIFEIMNKNVEDYSCAFTAWTVYSLRGLLTSKGQKHFYQEYDKGIDGSIL